MELHSYICHNRSVGDNPKNPIPGADILHPLSHRSPGLRDHFIGVQADLSDVVNQRKERGERKGGHKQRHETILDDCNGG